MNNNTKLLIAFNAWSTSQLSIAKWQGGIRINGIPYKVVGKEQDLVMESWIPVYKRLGRTKTIAVMNSGISLNKAMLLKNYTQEDVSEQNLNL